MRFPEHELPFIHVGCWYVGCWYVGRWYVGGWYVTSRWILALLEGVRLRSASTTSLIFSQLKANMPVLLDILTFFEGEGFVDRNGMVVSLHRVWVAAHYEENPVGLTLNDVTLARQRKRDCPAPTSLCLHPNSTLTPLRRHFRKRRLGHVGQEEKGCQTEGAAAAPSTRVLWHNCF